MKVEKDLDCGALYVSEEGAFFLTKGQLGLLAEVRDAARVGTVYDAAKESVRLKALQAKRAVEYADHPLLGSGWVITEHGKNILREKAG